MGFVSTYNTVSVGSTATVILAANNLRKGSLITNTGTTTVYIGFDANVTTSNGLPLIQNSTLVNSGDGECWRGTIYGIVASSTSDCRYWEYGP